MCRLKAKKRKEKERGTVLMDRLGEEEREATGTCQVGDGSSQAREGSLVHWQYVPLSVCLVLLFNPPCASLSAPLSAPLSVPLSVLLSAPCRVRYPSVSVKYL